LICALVRQTFFVKCEPVGRSLTQISFGSLVSAVSKVSTVLTVSDFVSFIVPSWGAVWQAAIDKAINISVQRFPVLIIFISILQKKTPIKIDWRLDLTYLDVNQLL
tara:strand:+ start:850 stop:1167 length:318 start_codon:yes stop_codon:yes gene_type:complete